MFDTPCSLAGLYMISTTASKLHNTKKNDLSFTMLELSHKLSPDSVFSHLLQWKACRKHFGNMFSPMGINGGHGTTQPLFCGHVIKKNIYKT